MEDLPSNKSNAMERIFPKTRKLDRENKLATYYNVFKQWDEEDLIENVTDKTKNCHYLPHHAVIKDSQCVSKFVSIGIDYANPYTSGHPFVSLIRNISVTNPFYWTTLKNA